MGKKGLLFDDKRAKMLEYFFEQKSVFSPKELEKDLPKIKGIISQSVKEVLQSLVDDDMVDQDKIGSGNFYWAFKSKATRKRQTRIEQLKKAAEDRAAKMETLHSRKRKAEETRKPSDERSAKLARLAELQAAKAELDQKLGQYSAFDPEKIKELQIAAAQCRDHANRWTDNIETLWSFFKEKIGETPQAKWLEHFGLPPELEPLE